MANVEGRPTLKLEIVLVLSEEEAGALVAVFGYSADSFLETFYTKMGRAYLEPYEKGLRSLHASIGGQLKGIIDRANKARQVFITK